jgi:hypothetical protein
MKQNNTDLYFTKTNKRRDLSLHDVEIKELFEQMTRRPQFDSWENKKVRYGTPYCLYPGKVKFLQETPGYRTVWRRVILTVSDSFKKVGSDILLGVVRYNRLPQLGWTRRDAVQHSFHRRILNRRGKKIKKVFLFPIIALLFDRTRSARYRHLH